MEAVQILTLQSSVQTRKQNLYFNVSFHYFHFTIYIVRGFGVQIYYTQKGIDL